MRIVVLTNVVWPDSGITAGGTVHALEVAREFAKCHDVVVVVPKFIAGQVANAYPALKLSITPMPSFLLKSTIGTLLFSAFSWIAQADTIKRADHVLASSHFLGDVLPAGLLHWRRNAVIVHHLIEPPGKRQGSFVRNVLAFAFQIVSLGAVRMFAGAIATSSGIVRDDLVRRKLQAKVVITTNAPGHLSMKPPPASARIRGRVVALGRLAPTKSIETLLESWKIVRAACPNATLHVLGDGDTNYRRALESRAAAIALDGSIRFLGRVDDTTKERELLAASVFAFPSREEGFGIALAEAMQAALPSVTFDLAVLRDVFGDAGRVSVTVGDIRGFGDALASLLRDDARRRRMAEEAESFAAATFSWSRAARLDLEALRLAAGRT